MRKPPKLSPRIRPLSVALKKGYFTMSVPDLTVSHARELVTQITQGDDGAHAEQLLELIHGIADPDSIVAMEVEKQLYSLTPDFQSHFAAYLNDLKVA